MKMIKVLTVFIALMWVSIGQVSIAGAGAILQDLENQLMCKCDDKCGKVLINCIDCFDVGFDRSGFYCRCRCCIAGSRKPTHV